MTRWRWGGTLKSIFTMREETKPGSTHWMCVKSCCNDGQIFPVPIQPIIHFTPIRNIVHSLTAISGVICSPNVWKSMFISQENIYSFFSSTLIICTSINQIFELFKQNLCSQISIYALCLSVSLDYTNINLPYNSFEMELSIIPPIYQLLLY